MSSHTERQLKHLLFQRKSVMKRDAATNLHIVVLSERGGGISKKINHSLMKTVVLRKCVVVLSKGVNSV